MPSIYAFVYTHINVLYINTHTTVYIYVNTLTCGCNHVFKIKAFSSF